MTRKNPENKTIVAVRSGAVRFTFDSLGNLNRGSGPVVADNVLFGGMGRDKIEGLTGNDLKNTFSANQSQWKLAA